MNAGIILYNLTRMRTMVGGGFTEAIRFTFRKYGEHLKLIEQDILNIIFEKSPKYGTENILYCLYQYYRSGIFMSCHVSGTIMSSNVDQTSQKILLFQGKEME